MKATQQNPSRQYRPWQKIACAFIGRFLENIDAYVVAKNTLHDLVKDFAVTKFKRQINVTVNAADNIVANSIYLTVTGTSAEAGDDGEVGRGNRSNGLITPYRPMSMEAVAGKNPVTHVGKLYNLVANTIAHDIIRHLADVESVDCYLVSQIGQPITKPLVADIKISSRTGQALTSNIVKSAHDIVVNHLEQLSTYWQLWLNGGQRP